MPSFYEFFAGGGMARAGLGTEWQCLFANDFDRKKGRIYCLNWGFNELKTTGVESLTTADVPGAADLAWASFPCQDLSLAGGGAGLKGDRSGTFRPFWSLMKGLMKEDRAPALIVLENVCGTLNSHDGADFATICSCFQQDKYLVGAIVVDASLFVPQSRPRLFIIGVRRDIDIPKYLTSESPSSCWHTRTLRTAHAKLPPEVKASWIWWRLPLPPARKSAFSDVIDDEPTGVEWFSEEETLQLLATMSPINRAKVADAQRLGHRVVGGVYKRTRANESGFKVQRAEIRFDNVSGCLRTPAGGSSRQVVVVVNGESVRARLISTRETARLMGLPDRYSLPENYNEAYHLTGDGVVVSVVRHLAKYIFEPLLDKGETKTAAA